MQQHKTIMGGQNSSPIFFASKLDKVDFETGQYAAIRGKKLEDNPFRLAERRIAWNRGFRHATYENDERSPQINSESTQRGISKLRSQLTGR
jgi:hypothetical protein